MANDQDDQPKSAFSEVDEKLKHYLAIAQAKKMKEEHERKEEELAEKRKTNPFL